MIEAIKRRLDAIHLRLTKALKRAKTPLTGKGRMMELYEGIRASAGANDKEAIRTYLAALIQNAPGVWNGQYHKTVELILLCQYLLVSPENTREIAAARYRLERVVDERHEIGQRILVDFLALP